MSLLKVQWQCSRKGHAAPPLPPRQRLRYARGAARQEHHPASAEASTKEGRARNTMGRKEWSDEEDALILQLVVEPPLVFGSIRSAQRQIGRAHV